MMQANTITLYCFPYSGGGATVYRNWQPDLPTGVQIRAYQLPGREERFDEEPFGNFTCLMAHLYEVLLPAIKPPYALFGHSMGAIVAFEFAREIRRRKLPLPDCLFVSGADTPQLLAFTPPYIHKLSDAELLKYLKKLGGPAEFFHNTELQKLFLPLLRTDFKAIESYRYYQEPPFNFPIVVLGSADDILTSLNGLDAWRQQTTNDFRLRILAGNHDFINTAREHLLTTLGEELSSILMNNY